MYDSSIRTDLIKIIERLPLETVAKIRAFTQAILPYTQPITLQDIKNRREEILEIAGKRGVSNMAVFGSVVRGEAGGKSDVDFLVDMEPGRSLFDLSGFMIDMEELLGYKVDVALRKTLKEGIREKALKEAVKL